MWASIEKTNGDGFPKLPLGIIYLVYRVQLLVWGMSPTVGERHLPEGWASLLRRERECVFGLIIGLVLAHFISLPI